MSLAVVIPDLGHIEIPPPCPGPPLLTEKVQKVAFYVLGFLTAFLVAGTLLAPAIWEFTKEYPRFTVITGLVVSILSTLVFNVFGEFLKQDHPIAYVYARRGNCAFRNGDLSYAIQNYGESLKWSKTNGLFQTRLANAKRLNKQVDQAIQTFNSAEETNPGEPFLFSRRAACYIQLEDLDAARIDIASTHKLKPKDPFHHLLRGAVQYDQLEKKSNCVKSFRYALSVRHNDPFALTLLSYYNLFDRGDASLLKQLVKKKIFSHSHSMALQGILLRHQGQHDQALKCFLAVEEGEFNDNDIGFAREAWKDGKDPCDSLKNYASSRAERLGLTNSVLLADLGWKEFSIEIVGKFLITSNLVRALGLLGHQRKDLSKIEEGLKYDPTSLELRRTRGMLLCEKGEYVKAKDVILAVLEHNSNDMQLKTLLAQCFADEQNFRESIKLIDEVISHYPSEESYKTLRQQWQSLLQPFSQKENT